MRQDLLSNFNNDRPRFVEARSVFSYVDMRMNNAASNPMANFKLRYHIFDTSRGIKEKPCKCTENPEKPSANAVKTIEAFASKSGELFIKSHALLTSKSGETVSKTSFDFIVKFNTSASAQKKII